MKSLELSPSNGFSWQHGPRGWSATYLTAGSSILAEMTPASRSCNEDRGSSLFRAALHRSAPSF